MIGFELALLGTITLVAAVAGVVLALVVRRGAPSALGSALSDGRFRAALQLADGRPPQERDDLLAAAVAAKHLLRWSRARTLLERLLEEDEEDGEALLEAGLVATYRGRTDEAATLLTRASTSRADLLESVTLHRAFSALVAGELELAHTLFEEVEMPLETKLAIDLGAGEALFAEWFLHAACLWTRFDGRDKGWWAWQRGTASAPESLLPGFIRDELELGPAAS